MRRVPDYPSIIKGSQHRSVLPLAAQTAIRGIRSAIDEKGDPTLHLAVYNTHLDLLPPEAIMRAGREIRGLGGLYSRWKYYRGRLAPGADAADPSYLREVAALNRYPGLARFFIFHGDGRLREASLKAMDTAPASPFVFLMIAERLNDWVWQVRAAARDRARALFPKTRAEVIARVALFLFPRIWSLARWGESERAVLLSILYREDVVREFAALLRERPPDPVGRVFRQALRMPGLDPMLDDMAKTAALPVVRAIACDVLIMGRVRWVEGQRTEWVDKSLGKRRWVPCVGERPISHGLDTEQLIARTAADPAVTVRKVAANALVQLRHTLSPEMLNVGRQLVADKSAAVRSIADFYLRKELESSGNPSTPCR